MYLLTEETTSTGSGSIIGAIVGLLLWAGIIAIIIYAVKKNKKEKLAKEIENTNQISEMGISVTKKLEGSDYSIIVDDNSHKFLIKTDEMDKYKTYQYSDIVGCEIVENNGQQSKTSGNGMKTLLGGAVFGGVGALAGMSGKKKTTSVDLAYSLGVRIMVNDLSTPYYQLEIFSGKTKTTSNTYQEAVKEAQEILTTINIIKGKK